MYILLAVLIFLIFGAVKVAASVKIEHKKTSLEKTSESFKNYKK